MAEEFLFLTELFGLKVYDLRGVNRPRKGRRHCSAGLTPCAWIVPDRRPRHLLTVRYDQVKTISLDALPSRRKPHTLPFRRVHAAALHAI